MTAAVPVGLACAAVHHAITRDWAQGFLPDARTNFLTYAERMQQAGDLDESFRALVEFCDLAPDDVQVRITVADQMAAEGEAFTACLASPEAKEAMTAFFEKRAPA